MSLFNPSNSASATASCADGGACSESVSTVKPAYTVQETAEGYRLVVQLPGVAKDGLELTAENNEIRITGRRSWTQPQGWTSLHRETAGNGYELVLTHENAVDAEKIVAELRDGVLNVTLPKPEALKPRKIAVT